MDLTPNEIRNQEFGTQMRGYDKGEVDSYMQQSANALEDACMEIKKLSDEVLLVKGQMVRYKEFEDSIKAAAIDARRNADDLLKEASAKAEEIVEEAHTEASNLMTVQKQKVAHLQKQIEELVNTKESYTDKLRELLHSHMQLVDSVVSLEFAEPKSGEPIEVTDSSEVDAETRETMATEPSTEEQHVESGEVSESPAEPSPIDPELATALDQYQHQADHPTTEPSASNPALAGMPENIVVTTARAEDVPPGFIVKEEDKDKPPAAADTDGTQEKNPAAQQPPVPGTGKIAQVIEEAVAKFEKEIENARQ